MTTKKKAAPKKRAPKAAVAPIEVGSYVAFAKPKAGEPNPIMTVTMLTAEYDGPREIPVAECAWIDGTAGVEGRLRARLSELQLVASRGEALKDDAIRAQAEDENRQHEIAVARIREQFLDQQRAEKLAKQAAAQEQKGAV